METAWRLYVRKLAVRGRDKRAKVTEDPAEMTELLRDAEARDTVGDIRGRLEYLDLAYVRYGKEQRISQTAGERLADSLDLAIAVGRGPSGKGAEPGGKKGEKGCGGLSTEPPALPEKKGRSARGRRARGRKATARAEALERLQEAIRKVLKVARARRRERRTFAARFIQHAVGRRKANLYCRGLRPEDVRAWRLNLHTSLLKPFPRCRWGANLAGEAEFAEQRREAQAVVDHWETYLQIFLRLEKRAFRVLDLCSAQGGQFEGLRRRGVDARALDHTLYPEFVERFGAEHLTVGDATGEATVLGVGRECLDAKGKRWWPDGYVASPPCQSTSSMCKAGAGLTESKEAQLLPKMRALLDRIGKPYILENVMGAHSQGFMAKDVSFTNHDFGLKAYRPRCFEANFPLVKEVDGRWLSKRSCLGRHNRMPRRDRFGRRRVCCGCWANSFGVYSTRTPGVTHDMWAEAMGVDPTHMSDRGLALAIPPVFTEYLVGQMLRWRRTC
jgi:hypothetical protein